MKQRSFGRIVCIGQSRLDRRYHADISKGESLVRYGVGGTACTVADRLGRLGDNVALLSVMGRDGASDLLRTSLEAHSVDVSLTVERPQIGTGECVHLVGTNGSMQCLGGQEMPELEPADIVAAVPALRDAFYLFLDRSGYTAARSVINVKDLGFATTRIIVDFAATNDPLPQDLSGIGIAFVGERQLSAISGRPTTPQTVASLTQDILRRGVGAVVATTPRVVVINSADGALVVNDDLGGQAVLGSHDGMIAGVLHDLAHGHDLVGAVYFGCVIASALGSNPFTYRPSPIGAL